MFALNFSIINGIRYINGNPSLNIVKEGTLKESESLEAIQSYLTRLIKRAPEKFLINVVNPNRAIVSVEGSMEVRLDITNDAPTIIDERRALIDEMINMGMNLSKSTIEKAMEKKKSTLESILEYYKNHKSQWMFIEMLLEQ